MATAAATRSAAKWAALAALAGVAGLAAMLGGCGDDVTPEAADPGEFGSVGNVEEFTNAPQALPPAALREPPLPLTLPASARLTNLPAVATQGTVPKPLGSPGSCEALAFGTGLGSYTAARAPDGSVKWSAADPVNEVSGAFQFSLAIDNGFATCKGGLATPYLGRLASFGSPNASEVPYQPSCEYFGSIDLNKQYPSASRLRIGSFATFKLSAPGSLDRIKEYLANQQAIAFSGAVYQGYGNLSGPPLTDGYFYAKDLTSAGGHGQLLVGYDDNAGAASFAKGMLLVQNSFGTQWPSAPSKAPPGQLFWAYETFLRNQTLAAVAYPYDASPPKGSLLTASDPKAPVAAVERAWQWSPEAGGAVWLVLMHHMADPVRITNIAVKEPGTGGATAIGKYGQFLSKGYTYLRRTDGKEFLAGTYTIRYNAQTLAGDAVVYDGTFTVGRAEPTSSPAASMNATTPVPPSTQARLFDSIGQAALLSP